MTRKALRITVAATIFAALPLCAQLELVGEAPAHSATADLTQAEVVAALATFDPTVINQVRTMGLLVFSTPFNTFDGHGDGPFDGADPRLFGHRPTLQGSGQFLRLNGLDAQACNECHVVVKNSTLPPTLGLAGVGTVPESAFPLVQLADFADSADNRVTYQTHNPDLPLSFDGEADMDGRFINPPFLYGGGGVELLAKEMTLDLQARLGQALSAPMGTVLSLSTHGTYYGTLTSVDANNVTVNLAGIGPHDLSGTVSKEVARDALVVRPFGRKGDNFSMRDFDRGAMQFHFGIQAVERPEIGAGDPDGDGVFNEVTVAEMSALHTFDVTNPPPFMDPLNAEAITGGQLFVSVGCAYCHHPFKTTYQKFLPLATPETPYDPLADVYAAINMRTVGFQAVGNGVKVPLFADLKRHYMGDLLAETCERCADESQAANAQFTTARLWGIADTAPYIHDGRATTLRQAIDFHGCNPGELPPPHDADGICTGGEAQFAHDNYFALSEADQARVLYFLRHLRTPNHPNDDIRP